MAKAEAARNVVITRPSGQGERLLEALENAGFHCVLFPALAIESTPHPEALDGAFAQLLDYQLVVFVSPNAIDCALDRLCGPWPESVAIAVMGPGSRDRLAQRGIAAPRYRVISPDDGPIARFDSEALFGALDIKVLAGTRCLLVQGNGGRTWLSEALRAAQVEVQCVASYERSIGRPNPEAFEQLAAWIAQGTPATFVLTSTDAIEKLHELLGKAFGDAGGRWLLQQTVLVSHQRIAENATAAGFRKVVLTEPGDEALVRALE